MDSQEQTSRFYRKGNSDYLELLKSAPWQALRLKILTRDEWTCRLCHSTALLNSNDPSSINSESKISFHVHHTFYLPKKKPWEYPEDSLVTLCSHCHEIEGENLRDYSADVVTIMKQQGFMASDFQALCEGISSLERRIAPDTPYSHAELLKWVCKNSDILRDLFFSSNFGPLKLPHSEQDKR